MVGRHEALSVNMITRCEECDHVLGGDEVEHLYKGRSYCEDCYKVVKATV
jgi:hypothetical protein